MLCTMHVIAFGSERKSNLIFQEKPVSYLSVYDTAVCIRYMTYPDEYDNILKPVRL